MSGGEWVTVGLGEGALPLGEGWEWKCECGECSTTCMVSEAELGLVPQGALLHPIVCTQELERSKPCSEGEGLGWGVTGESQAGASKRAARGREQSKVTVHERSAGQRRRGTKGWLVRPKKSWQHL